MNGATNSWKILSDDKWVMVPNGMRYFKWWVMKTEWRVTIFFKPRPNPSISHKDGKEYLYIFIKRFGLFYPLIAPPKKLIKYAHDIFGKKIKRPKVWYYLYVHNNYKIRIKLLYVQAIKFVGFIFISQPNILISIIITMHHLLF